jgi:4-hydroxy-4-methyl-2-oxoglutarate aldolase
MSLHHEPPAPLIPLNESEYAALRALDSCSVANAIESYNVQLRNEGFTAGNLTCRFPELSPMVGYAFPIEVRTSAPPIMGRTYVANTSWWDRLLEVPEPRILVVQDIDPHPGAGAFVGGTNAEIFRKLGCIGAVTNGAVRDLPRIKPLQFQMYSSQLTVSHGYSHVVRTGVPVQIEGLEVRIGDLLHGDMHGIVRIPRDLAAGIPQTARTLREKEAALAEYCSSPDFSLTGLRSRLNS